MAERLAALIVLVAGGVYIALALSYPRGVAARPGAGFFPLIIGVFICVAAGAFALETFRRRPARRAEGTLTAEARHRVLATSGVLAFFCLALPWIGYTAASFVFVAVMLRALGAGWTTALATAAISAGASYYLFAVLLTVPLPAGVWF
jgi:hypothetical protein